MNKFIRNTQLDFFRKEDRQSMILEELNRSEGIVRKNELASKFYVSERTIVRDIKEILRENNSIMVISGRKGGYKNLKGNDKN